MIRDIQQNDIPECVQVIQSSFLTVAAEFGLTIVNAPRYTAFAISEERLEYQLWHEKRRMRVYCKDDKIVGYCSLLVQGNVCEMNNLCLLPEYRHCGYGAALLEDVFQIAGSQGCTVIHIGIVEENRRLRAWYETFGFVHIGTEKFDFFPFTCGYMEKKL